MVKLYNHEVYILGIQSGLLIMKYTLRLNHEVEVHEYNCSDNMVCIYNVAYKITLMTWYSPCHWLSETSCGAVTSKKCSWCSLSDHIV